MKKLVLILAVLFVFGLGSAASAATTKEGIYCRSKHYLNEVKNSDTRNGLYLRKIGACFCVKAGYPLSILDESGWDAWAKVRVYVGNSAVVLWTDPRFINYDSNNK